MGQALLALVLQIVILAALLLMVLLPFVVLVLFFEHRRARSEAIPLATASILLAGFLIGGAIGWACRPDAWTMPLWQTAEASMNFAKYGHPLEAQAERVLLYFLYGGVLGTAAAALAAPLILRYLPTGRPPSGSSASASGTCT
ncbi:MAG TPA: hypothetical protein VGK29_18450 [Paludibaculum sp.]|jgi:hypothetical protein